MRHELLTFMVYTPASTSNNDMRARHMEELWNVTRAFGFVKLHPIIPTTVLLALGSFLRLI
jgi:hypothetical protein